MVLIRPYLPARYAFPKVRLNPLAYTTHRRRPAYLHCMNTLLPTLLLLLVSVTAAAQVDAKLNVGSALTGGMNAAIEFPLGAQSSLSIGGAYSSLGLTVDDDDYKYRNLRLIPEYRYYFAPRRRQDGFFAGGYGKLGRLRGTDRANDNSIDVTRAALGVLAGHKWVAGSGFVFELNAGAGRAATFGGNGEDALYARAIGSLTAFDVRLGILVGWRL